MSLPAVLKLRDGTLAITSIPGGDKNHEIRRLLENPTPVLTTVKDRKEKVFCVAEERRYVHRGYIPIYEEQP